jgi:hypothetical protein
MKKFLGYTVVNTKSQKFIDVNGRKVCEYEESFDCWDDKTGPTETLGEIDWCLKHQNNKMVRRLRKERKHIKIAQLFVVAR